ncbi:MAG TPA: YicC/YloC family endoribonuclease [Roseiarcus sp.]|jgi:uncharacterized protein (TIGR00255 family)|nr:YicC/YloC family endoribonuclease [Roseiarcus sp.]
MRLSSMTGFARAAGAQGAYRWVFEVKSVNAKGLDLRLRLPPGFDRIESEARARLGKALARGACFATLSVQREGVGAEIKINAGALAALAVAGRQAAEGAGLAPPTIDGLLAVRGVVDLVESEEEEAGLAAACEGALKSLDQAIAALVAMRQAEGAALAAFLAERLIAIAALTKAADDNPGRRPEAIRARLAQSVAALLEAGRGFDENRLHQEAVLLAAKADIREELDRLATHVAAARELMSAGGPVGRRLDFLAQELAREANTLCAKANDVALTAIGLDLRSQIEQLREQIQNIE